MKQTKVILFLLIAALALTITGCGGQEKEETSEESMKKETTAVTEAVLSIDGTPVTVADLIGGTGVFLVFNDAESSTLQLMSRTVV